MAAFTLIVGTLAITSRSQFSLLASLLQAQSQEARDAAESGMNRIISQLNQRPRRPLMLTAGTGGNGVWSQSDAAALVDPCGGAAASDLLSGLTTAWTYLDHSGRVLATGGDPPSGTTQAYRLVGVTAANRTDLVLLSSTGGTGNLVLRVEGRAFQGGRLQAHTLLERRLEVVPKCCGLAPGRIPDPNNSGAWLGHGNLDYQVLNASAQVTSTTALRRCLLNAGVILGLKPTDNGALNIIGNGGVSWSDGGNYSPLLCDGDPLTPCPSNPAALLQTRPLNLLTTVPPIQPPTGLSAQPLELCRNLNDCPSNHGITGEPPNPDSNSFTYCFQEVLDSHGQKRCAMTIVNGSTSRPPAFCRSVSRAGEVELHCLLSKIDFPAGTNVELRFVHGSRQRIMLFFPVADANSHSPVIGMGGSALMANCTNVSSSSCIAPADITSLSLLGCPFTSPYADACGTQTLQLHGTPGGLNMFIYMPYANLQLMGDTNFNGVLWADTLAINGNASLIIPPEGVIKVLQLMCALPTSTACPSPQGAGFPFAIDQLVRSTHSQRFEGGT